MIPTILHQTAPTKKLSWEEARLRERTIRKLPGWEFHLWDDAANRELVSSQFPQYLAAYDSINRGVVKADIARLMYMAVFGGFYVDTDYRIFKSIDADLLNRTCILPVSRGNPRDLHDEGFRLGNAVFGSVAGHPFWSGFIDHIFESSLGKVAENKVEQTTGPEALTEFYLAHRTRFEDIVLLEKPVFHPQLSLNGFRQEIAPETIGAHLCWGSWRSKGVVKGLLTVARRKAQGAF